MSELEKTYISLSTAADRKNMTAAPAMLVVTVLYLVAVLSIPIDEPQRLIWLAAYPIVASEMCGLGFGKVFLKSLWILPLVVCIGIFNPIIDRVPAFDVAGVTVSHGWVTFISILLRGLLSFQAVVLMIMTTGFLDVFNIMRKFRFPASLTTQMMLTYRYLAVVMNEAMLMRRALAARGYGRSSYPLKMWGRFIGQLLIRSTERATRIHRAMKARGFDGSMPTGQNLDWNGKCWGWLLGWSAFICLLRFVDFSSLMLKFVS